MPLPRKFDHDEARRRHAAGEGVTALAREFRVSYAAVLRVVNPNVRARMGQQSLEHARRKREPCKGGCGRLVWRHGAEHRARSGYCPTCHGLQRAQTVRPTTLLCSRCQEWMPDAEFPKRASANARRGRAGDCRQCGTARRREHRHANREASNAYDREYKARRRAQAKAAA